MKKVCFAMACAMLAAAPTVAVTTVSTEVRAHDAAPAMIAPAIAPVAKSAPAICGTFCDDRWIKPF